MCRGDGGGTTGSTYPRPHSSSTAHARRNPSSSTARNNAFRDVSARRPVRPTRCRNAATDRGASIWIIRSRSPMSTPNSSVEVATITQSLASANARSLTRRSSADSEECDTNVVIPRARNSNASSSARRRDSQNTSRFSPRYSRESTSAALPTDPT